MQTPVIPPQDRPSKLLVFDLDGTLIDTAEDLLATLNAILAGIGINPKEPDMLRHLVGQGARKMIQRAMELKGHPLTDDRLEILFAAFLSHYEQNIAVHSRPYPGLLTALDRLEADGWAFAICTNKLEHPARRLMQELGLADRFLAICGQDTFSVCKPKPGALLQTIELAGGDPHRTIMVGDTRTDIDTAKAAHIPVIAVDFGYSEQPVATFQPEMIISHFDALEDAVAALAKNWTP